MHVSTNKKVLSISKEEILPWANFCAFCFSYKNPAPSASYFYNHFINDPRCDETLIRVIYDSCQTQKIISCLRIFRRLTNYNGEVVEVCGIGEVCTDPSHRRQGLVRLLLNDSFLEMKQQGIKYSLLHATESLQEVYKKCGGYKSLVSRWSVVTIDLGYGKKNENNDDGTVLRLAKFPEDVYQLQEIHRRYSEERFNGCIIRSIKYWNEYIGNEIGSSLYVLVSNEIIIGWMSIKWKHDKYLLQEYGLNTQTIKKISIGECTMMLLRKCLISLTDQKIDVFDDICLHLPTAILEEWENDSMDKNEPSVVLKNIEQNNDTGWMYKIINNSRENQVPPWNVRNKKVDYLIWPSENF